MTTLTQTLQDYSGRTMLTAKEKKIVINAYEDCTASGLVNFLEDIVVSKVNGIDSNIPKELICAFVIELESKKVA